VVNGTATLGGSITVLFANNYVPMGNPKSWKLLSATAGVTGKFSNTALPARTKLVYNPKEVDLTWM
jgi:hypothetical protein